MLKGLSHFVFAQCYFWAVYRHRVRLDYLFPVKRPRSKYYTPVLSNVFSFCFVHVPVSSLPYSFCIFNIPFIFGCLFILCFVWSFGQNKDARIIMPYHIQEEKWILRISPSPDASFGVLIKHLFDHFCDTFGLYCCLRTEGHLVLCTQARPVS